MSKSYFRFLLIASLLLIATCFRSEAQIVTEPGGLVSLWAGEGSAADATLTNDGTLRGNVAFATGRVGEGFSFDGSGGYIEIPDSPSLSLVAESTLMAWIRLDVLPSVTGFNYIAGRSAGGNDFDLEIESDNRVRFYPCGGTGGGGYPGSTTLVQTGLWYHVAATYKAGEQMGLSINGVNEVSIPINCTLGDNHSPFTIGFSPLWGRPFHGRIDQIRLYNRSLSRAEIESVYASESGGASTGILSIRVSQVELCFETAPGQWYQFQYQFQLSSSGWLPLCTNIYQGDGGVLCTTDAVHPGDPHKYYRIFPTDGPSTLFRR